MSFACIDPSGVGPRPLFQRVPEGKVVKNRVHLDVRVGTGFVGEKRSATIEAECARLTALGAVRVRLLRADGYNESCIVMQDIEATNSASTEQGSLSMARLRARRTLREDGRMSEFPEWSVQSSTGVRFDWGPVGAQALGPQCAALVVVDVLSFTTAVSVAVEAGTRVLPYPWRDDTAAAFAAEQGAELAVGRRAVSQQQPWSLSPAALRAAPAPERLVLPSPNGSAISAAAEGIPVIAACLRNAGAVADWIIGQRWGTVEHPVAVIAAGEHWPGRATLRPAVEDWLGAAAVIAALAEHGAQALSPEASIAASGYAAVSDVRALVRDCASGRELAAGGFGADVAIAIEVETSRSVPVLVDGCFVDATCATSIH